MTLEHAAAQADVEETQNEELLLGNREILDRVLRLEETILALERSIAAAVVQLEQTDGGAGGR